MLVSGLLGGWLMTSMLNPSEEHASSKSWWSLTRCGFALSCWMKMGLCRVAAGHFALIAGIIPSISFAL